MHLITGGAAMIGITETAKAVSQNAGGSNVCVEDYRQQAKIGTTINGEFVTVGFEQGKVVVEKFIPTPAPLPASPEQQSDQEWLL